MHDLINNISYELNATIAATLRADMPPRGGDVSRHGSLLTTAGEAGARSFFSSLRNYSVLPRPNRPIVLT